jgi:hypothetical protein
MAPTLTPDRAAWREMLATLAAKTKTKIPELNGRVEKAVKLALAGDVELHDDGSATVYSSSDPTRRYEIREGTCTCRDYEQAPQQLCQHRLSAGLVRRTQELLPRSTPVETEGASTALPEAPASANCHIMIAGRQVQLTLRDTDETRLLERLAAVLQQYPASQPAPQASSTAEGWCAQHGVPMQWNAGKEGRKGWHSHRTDEGWCKGR